MKAILEELKKNYPNLRVRLWFKFYLSVISVQLTNYLWVILNYTAIGARLDLFEFCTEDLKKQLQKGREAYE